MSFTKATEPVSEREAAEPVVSFLLPTRNGMPYLRFAVESVLALPYPHFELIVSDNHSTDGSADYLATIEDSRCTVIRPDQPLSMIDHFEYLSSTASGKWMTIIGDDDGVLPFFFEIVTGTELDVLACNTIVTRRAYYFWEGCEELYGSRVFAFHPGDQSSRLFNKLAIFLCLSSIITYLHMPQLYTTGLVRRSYFNEVKNLSGGRFYYGISPDASSAVALALHTPWHLRLEECLFWTGTSPKSVGFSQGSTNSKTRSIEFDKMNSGSRNNLDSRVLPPEIIEKFDWSVIFYSALLAHPKSGWIWSSRFVRNSFLAGLLEKDESLLPVICGAYRSRWLRFELKPYRLFVKMIGWFYVRYQVRIGATKVTAYFQSSDRAEYPTLHEASKEAYRTWLEAKHRV